MGVYRIEIKNSAAKEIAKLQAPIRDRIIERIRSLALDPRPSGCKKLSGEDKFRVRQGDYRILYQVFDETVLIVVVKVRHRREVYRK